MKEIVIGPSITGDQEEKEAALIERAQQGDHDAFGELVRRHRSKAHAWATGITQDPYMADDIVQDALIKAFMHLGTLVDVARFLPWLRTIVHNQAMMKLRRGGPYGKERPFTSFETSIRSDRVDWENVESILTYMLRNKEQEYEIHSNPEELLVRKETLETILGLFSCLNHRERGIFEAFFFKHLSPQEIANMFDITTTSVYKTISRTRQKLQHERIRVYINEHLIQRREKKCMTKKLLERPAVYTERVSDSHFLGSRPSVTYCIWGLLQYTGKKEVSLAEVNALTGYAFCLNIFKETIHIGGPFIHAGEEQFPQALANLGFDFKVLSFLPVEPTIIGEVLNTIHRSIDKGIPAIIWDLFHAEFGLVYGYDDNKQQLNALDKLKEAPVTYDQLGKGKTSEIGLIAISEPNGIDRLTALRNMLDMILEHGNTADSIKHGDGELTKGLAAYDAWIEAYRGERVVPFFNAYNIAVYSELRQFAVQFLRGLKEEFKDHDNTCICDAVVHYETVTAELQGLANLFPFPEGGDPKDVQNIDKAVQLLQKAKSAETKGLLALKQMREFIISLRVGDIQ
ncbi:RNA polymerase sigma factor [Paenibacillus eucommiae]|uniref:RNA polymerase sigma factor n=1 Tax=Paenibacillus eucommiae TaxID=1355755 RepID=A0ABS4IP95_9BACL|nr:RNA polymerase sigma factor [Paenibacillus eucommiae]MBP1989379.1 RNA polymerase sigma factor (sigma-70 family) [Paenibacillus eucommiae]